MVNFPEPISPEYDIELDLEDIKFDDGWDDDDFDDWADDNDWEDIELDMNDEE